MPSSGKSSFTLLRIDLDLDRISEIGINKICCLNDLNRPLYLHGKGIGQAFRILKRVFGLVKVRYRGLKKNHEWLCAAFASANIYQHRKRLARIGQSMSPAGA